MNAAAAALSKDRFERFAILGMQTASLVHEMNNRLTAIVGTLDLFFREDLDPRCRENCRSLLKAQAGIVELVREAGALASGRMDAFLKTESVSMEDLMDQLRQAVPGVALVGTPGMVVACDPRKTVRALADISRNAWQAGAAHVRMDVRRSGPNVVLRIADDGPGIPPEVADLLFSPGATHGKPQGHGIGLFSARWILEAMGGSLRLERSDATGASFLVTLPLANREA